MSESTNKKSNKGLIVIIILLLLALGGGAFYFFQQNNSMTSMEEERERILFDLEEARKEVSNLESVNDSMDMYIVAREAELAAMIDSISSQEQITESQMKRWRTEAYNLRNKVSGLEAKVDSINKAYEVLAIEKAKTDLELQNEMAKVDELNVQNQGLQNELAIGARMQIVQINAGGYKVSGDGTDEETGRARRADRAKVCFSLGANDIAKKGERTVYMRVISPDLTVMTADKNDSGENSFTFQGHKLFYSDMAKIYYENKELSTCMSVDREDFAKGQYTVELYSEDIKLGEAKFVLD